MFFFFFLACPFGVWVWISSGTRYLPGHEKSLVAYIHTEVLEYVITI